MQDRDVALAIAEDDRVAEVRLVAQMLAQRFALGAAAMGGDENLLDESRCRADPGDFDPHRILQELLGQAGDFRRHGGREKQRLAGERHQLADFLDVGDEPHVEHPVRFVDHEDIDARQQQLAALIKVEQPARRCDQHVRAAHDLCFLIAEGDAANEQGDVEFVVHAIFDESLFNLRREFAGGFKNERPGHTGAGAARFEPGEHGEGECGSLAGARLGDAEDIPALKCVGDRLRLDRCRFGVTGGLYGQLHLFA